MAQFDVLKTIGRFLSLATFSFYLSIPTPSARKSTGKKDSKDEAGEPAIKKDEDESDSNSQDENETDPTDDVDVRDIRYRLEYLDINLTNI